MSAGNGSFRQRLVHDDARGAWMDGSRRYILVQPEALMGLFRRLHEPAGSDALRALAASIEGQGSDSALDCLKTSGTVEGYFENIAVTASGLGWGRWRFARDDDGLRLTVENSPFAAGYGPSRSPVCVAIEGILQAVGRFALGRRCTAREIECAATGAPRCTFRAE